MRILFILKKQLLSGGHYGEGLSSGLYNSAKFVSDMLRHRLGHHTKLVLVDDNNDIDREVTRYRPDAVIIEALWVVPNKFRELQRLHPHVLWYVRNHSATPFLAHEGMAMDWLLLYPQFTNVTTACNDTRTMHELQKLGDATETDGNEVLYMPNYYPPIFHPRRHTHHPHVLNVGCFGSVRPLKNQLIQAVAAIEYAEKRGKPLHFHMNTTRIEGGNPIMKNIRQMFKHMPHHRLIGYPWLCREDFLQVVRRMDIGLQCSYSETFNIIAADFVMNDVPIVVSEEISWVHPRYQVNPNDSHEIVRTMDRALRDADEQPHYHPSANRLIARDLGTIQEWANIFPEDCD